MFFKKLFSIIVFFSNSRQSSWKNASDIVRQCLWVHSLSGYFRGTATLLKINFFTRRFQQRCRIAVLYNSPGWLHLVHNFGCCSFKGFLCAKKWCFTIIVLYFLILFDALSSVTIVYCIWRISLFRDSWIQYPFWLSSKSNPNWEF